jgi:hypothetical protein
MTKASVSEQVQDVNHFAQWEGWAIFNECTIQRDDELNVFASDDEAEAHVRALADAGSRLHREALRLVGVPMLPTAAEVAGVEAWQG